MTETTDDRPIKIGQLWREVDPRFPNMPLIEVRGFSDDGRVIIGSPNNNGHSRKAQSKRFNGKRSGYKLVEDVL